MFSRTSLGATPWAPPVKVRHDAAGNLVFDGTYIYQYDAWKRLVQVNAGAKHPGVRQGSPDGHPRGLRRCAGAVESPAMNRRGRVDRPEKHGRRGAAPRALRPAS